MTKSALITACVFLCSCVPVEDPGPDYITNDPIYVFTPGTGAEEYTEQAMGRLRDSTGLPFRVGPGGFDVVLSEQPYAADADGVMHESCGITPVYFEPQFAWESRDDIRIVDTYIEVKYPPVDCWDDVSRIIEHEAIHASRRVIGASATDGDHSVSGVFQAYANADYKMDTTSLVKLCEVVPCVKFEIEE